jgi:hypothetical protein
VHALPLFFLTWAHSAGWPEQGLLTYAQMQSAIDVGYLTIAHMLKAPIAPVGVAWSTALQSRPRLGLWAEDGSHPAIAGTYLAACVLYAAIFRTTPEGIAYHDGLSANVASRLHSVSRGPWFSEIRGCGALSAIPSYEVPNNRGGARQTRAVVPPPQ